jgi:hypothetical protein
MYHIETTNLETYTMSSTYNLDQLLKLISNLNPKAGEIGAGMLAQICDLVEDAKKEVEELKLQNPST